MREADASRSSYVPESDVATRVSTVPQSDVATRASHAPGSYVLGVEWLRIVACLAVVAFHAKVPGHLYALGGLHIFAVFLTALGARSAQRLDWAAFVRRRSWTLALPWVFWTVVYALVFAVDRQRRGEDPLGWLSDGRWFAGPTIHLWFLPWALVTSLLLYPLSRSLRTIGWRPWFLLTLVAIAVTAWTARLPVAAPWAQWLSVLPGATLGMVLADPSSRPFRVLISVALVVALGALVGLGHVDTGIPLLMGLPAAVLAFGTRSSTNARLLSWSRLALGVYLVHPLTLRAFHKMFGESPWLMFLTASIAAFAVVILLRKTPLRAVV